MQDDNLANNQDDEFYVENIVEHIDQRIAQRDGYQRSDSSVLDVSISGDAEIELTKVAGLIGVQKSEHGSIAANQGRVSLEENKQNQQKEQQVEEERKKQRQIKLMSQLGESFYIAADRFHFKTHSGDRGNFAFIDKGEKMISRINDSRVAMAMAQIAESRDWKMLRVTGHTDFRRAVWFEASLRDIEVRGYKPREQDLLRLAEAREKNMTNAVINASHTFTGRRQYNNQQPVQQNTSKAHDSKVAQEKQSSKEANTVIGCLIDYGEAHFQFDEKNKKNYFVRLKSGENGEKEVIKWGVDLERAIKESGVKKGDEIELNFLGSCPVIVKEYVRDKDGNQIGLRELATHRNTWEAKKSDAHRVAELLGYAGIDANVKDVKNRELLRNALSEALTERVQKNGRMPDVPLYDVKAPPIVKPQREMPNIERTQQRTR